MRAIISHTWYERCRSRRNDGEAAVSVEVIKIEEESRRSIAKRSSRSTCMDKIHPRITGVKNPDCAKLTSHFQNHLFCSEMTLCFCSLPRPSPLIHHEPYLQWNTYPNKPNSFISFSSHRTSPSCLVVVRVAQPGVDVPSTSQESTIIIPAGEGEIEDSEPIDGAYGTELEEKTAAPPTKVKKKSREDDDSLDSRFRLRNGKEVLAEQAYLVGVERKGDVDVENSFGIEESLKELAQLADTAGLMIVGSTYQKLATPNPRTYIGSGKVAEIKSAIRALDVETVIFDDELSAGQLRNLEKTFGQDVRVCDRTALILDIFNQRAATHEASLQVALAQMEYQLPRLTKMWSHLERQAGGKTKGMGEKQIEVDKRILRNQIGVLKKELESVRKHRKQYRNRRTSVPVPVVSLVGYTNAGKSTLLNQLTGAGVLAEDKLFATLDPTTRRVQVAAFRATLEEISESSLLVHVDKAADPQKIKLEAVKRDDVVCISALTGEGLQDFCDAVQGKLKDSMVWVEALIPFDKGELLSTVHQVGMVETTVSLGLSCLFSKVFEVKMFGGVPYDRCFSGLEKGVYGEWNANKGACTIEVCKTTNSSKASM
ncbi:GTPase HflX [Linum perenne]